MKKSKREISLKSEQILLVTVLPNFAWVVVDIPRLRKSATWWAGQEVAVCYQRMTVLRHLPPYCAMRHRVNWHT
jgi:hypothetical protein